MFSNALNHFPAGHIYNAQRRESIVMGSQSIVRFDPSRADRKPIVVMRRVSHRQLIYSSNISILTGHLQSYCEGVINCFALSPKSSPEQITQSPQDLLCSAPSARTRATDSVLKFVSFLFFFKSIEKGRRNSARSMEHACNGSFGYFLRAAFRGLTLISMVRN